MNVSLTQKQLDYIANQIKEGDFQNASELVRDALRLHQIYRKRIIDELRLEIEKGWNARNSDQQVMDIIHAKTKEHQQEK